MLGACGSSSRSGLALGATGRAAPPFGGFDDARISLGGRCVRVLVASSDAQRGQGLRNVSSLGPYRGMLFVEAHDSHARFTMAATPLPLDIRWYAADGVPV